MLLIRRVVGDSMLPTLLPGHIVIAKKNKKPQIGAIVIAMISDREVIKRVASHSDRGYILLGDNPADSTDSRMYGAVSEQHIFGVV
ncbi:hypothetical protein CYG49_01290, partial [Candidatus Saccharibacteria bacterium]